jgi:hypothetical protein
MRGKYRAWILQTGKVTVVCVLAATAVAAMTSGRLGWLNYWGGFVYAPFGLAIAVLIVLVALKRRRDSTRPSRTRRERVRRYR